MPGTTSLRPFQDLTFAQNALLKALYEGQSLKAFADERGIAYWTARHHAIAMRMRFNAVSIGDLIAKVKAGSQPLPPPPPTPPPEPIDPAERARRDLAQAREFYDRLGPENPNQVCKRPGCSRGIVKYSVFCRRHDYEMIRRQPCPFEDDA